MGRTKTSTRKLSAREQHVLRRLAWGATHKEVADELHLSVKTVETHKANAARKLRLRSRHDMVLYAVEQGWFSTGPMTALEKRIAELKAELTAMKAAVVEGLVGWTPNTPIPPKVNQAFRRVLEIGSSLQEAKAVLDPKDQQ